MCRRLLILHQAFVAEKPTPRDGEQSKKNCNIWRLSQTAIEKGVESTTRYRKPVNGKRASKNGTPAPQRQKSGAKGGRAAKNSARARRTDLCENGVSGRKQRPVRDRRTRLERHVRSRTAMLAPEPQPLTPSTDSPAFDWSRVTGVTETTPDMDLFYDPPHTPLIGPFAEDPIICDGRPQLEDFMTLQQQPGPTSMFSHSELFNGN